VFTVPYFRRVRGLSPACEMGSLPEVALMLTGDPLEGIHAEALRRPVTPR
jgi:hypothetical protein